MSEEVFRDFWWLIFPVFGMAMALIGMLREDRRISEIHERARRDLGGT